MQVTPRVVVLGKMWGVGTVIIGPLVDVIFSPCVSFFLVFL